MHLHVGELVSIPGLRLEQQVSFYVLFDLQEVVNPQPWLHACPQYTPPLHSLESQLAPGWKLSPEPLLLFVLALLNRPTLGLPRRTQVHHVFLEHMYIHQA